MRQHWLRDIRIWANPPFRLLHAVLAKIKKEGAHIVLLCPGWKGILSKALPLSTAHTKLPKSTFFKYQGIKKNATPALAGMASGHQVPGEWT